MLLALQQADARDRFLVMLQERVSLLEDQLLALQKRAELEDRRWPASCFHLVKYEKLWFVCACLNSATWSLDSAQASRGFFDALDLRCPGRADEGEERHSTRLIFCTHRHQSCIVLEGVVASDVRTVTHEAVGGALEQAWGLHLLPASPQHALANYVEEMHTTTGLEEAIHCANRGRTEFERVPGEAMELHSGSAPKREAVLELLMRRRDRYRTFVVHHPLIQEMFANVFGKPAGS